MAEIMLALGTVGSFLASNAGTISTALSVGGALAAAGGSIYAGQANEQYAKDQARALKQKGDQEYAIAQRKAMESRRQKRAAMGRTLAVAAASGGGTGDTVADIMTGIETRGEYNALTDLYNGSVARTDLYNEAANVRQAGKDGRKASYLEAGSTLLGAGANIYSDYARRKQAKQSYDYAMGA